MSTFNDRPNEALLVIDVQKSVVREAYERDAVVANIATLVDRARAAGTPVVWVQHSDEDMPRGTGFLFSKSRLNVAISRAQCLAYLVCTEQLLNSRAKTVEDMYLIATLCAFVEYADPAA